MHNYVPRNSADFTSRERAPTVSIVGARGYAGLELVRILSRHPFIQLKNCYATKSYDLKLDLLDLEFEIPNCLSDEDISHDTSDFVFLATPAEVSAKLAPFFIQRGQNVIDLSGAFRLKKTNYEDWYNFELTDKTFIDQAIYGLQPLTKMPALNPKKPVLIANPGCYATAISLALIPLLKSKIISKDLIVIDAKSGTSGAGRKASENLLFSEVDGNCLPYRVGRHQHTPEIIETIENLADVKIEPFFSTHLLPTHRGIIASIYAQSLTDQIENVEEAFNTFYGKDPLVKFGKNYSQIASLTKISKTPYISISFELIGNKLYIFSVIDNLLKGAASQAVENLNALMKWPRETGLFSNAAHFHMKQQSHSLSPHDSSNNKEI